MTPSLAAPRRVVFFRTDRIGDLLLTLPAVKAFADRHPGCRIGLVTSPRTVDLVRDLPFVHDVLGWDHDGPVRTLVEFLRWEPLDAAVFFYPRWRAAVAARRAGVPARIGTAYRWFSFLFTHRIKVHRSANIRHESQYNLDLLAPFGVESGAVPAAVAPARSPEADVRAAGLLAASGAGARPVVLHTGSRGSALNAGPASYGALAAALEDAGYRVVLTAGPGEADRARAVAAAGGLPAERVVSPATLADLGGLLRSAAAVVGPSTGPIHLAAAVGTPVVALYPPLKSQLPARWRPLGDRTTVLTPHGAVCPTCLHEGCPLYNCMDGLDPERVVTAVRRATAPA